MSRALRDPDRCGGMGMGMLMLMLMLMLSLPMFIVHVGAVCP
jgi:hypothetical protein